MLKSVLVIERNMHWEHEKSTLDILCCYQENAIFTQCKCACWGKKRLPFFVCAWFFSMTFSRYWERRYIAIYIIFSVERSPVMSNNKFSAIPSDVIGIPPLPWCCSIQPLLLRHLQCLYKAISWKTMVPAWRNHFMVERNVCFARCFKRERERIQNWPVIM